MKQISTIVLGVLAVVLADGRSATAALVNVVSCGQVVGPDDVGQLVGDLTCTGSPNAAVVLHGRKLLLNGHKISGGEWGIFESRGKPVKILGPGEISGANVCGITGGALIIRDVVVRNNGCGILGVYSKTVRLQNVSLIDNLGAGFHRTVDAFRGRFVARNVIASNNGASGIDASSTLESSPYELRDVTIENNGRYGFVSTTDLRGRVVGSTLTGNALGDLVAKQAPHIRESICGQSVLLGGLGNLGICTGD